ncbi:MAG: 8-amino-7-oxononanoate synthase [Thermodesulfobacteriota bacterium]
MDRLNWLRAQHEQGRLRDLTPVQRGADGQVRLVGGDDPLRDFSSNDYLGLSVHPQLVAGSRDFLDRSGCGAGASRLMSGDLDLHHLLEAEVAALKGQEAALLFGSGYQANCGIIPALVGRSDVIFSDRLNHASIHDGCLLSRARVVRFRHNDMEHLEELLQSRRGSGEALIIAESLYSMDGDRCPLADLVILKNRYGCLLMIDEAHATGVYGAHGGGIIEEEGLTGEVDLAMGTFGKALGSYGAYVAASREMIDFLVNRARSFIYSTALPPAVIGASLAAVRLVREQPELRSALATRVTAFRQALRRRAIEPIGVSQIMPVLVGDNARTVAVAARLRQQGVFVTAVRPPTVPEGTARLRFSVTLHLEEKDLNATAAMLASILAEKT